MAKKKWKKRLKKIAKAALIGGALYAGSKLLKGKAAKGAVSTAGQAVGVGRITPPKTEWIKKIKKAPDILPKPKPDRNLYNEWDTIIKAPEDKRPTREPTNLYNQAMGSGVMFKKGGRVTGIAKRGFGRALMKGPRR